jgi:phage shock protein E
VYYTPRPSRPPVESQLMTVAALAVAVVAFLMAFAARKRATELSETLEQALREQSSRAEQLAEMQKSLDAHKRFLELLAAGHEVDPLMVREKRLYKSIKTAELAKRVEAGETPYVIDVRSDSEWNGGHVPGAVHIPVEQLEKRMNEVKRDGTPMFIVCASGGRSSSASELLSNRGFLNVNNVDGGMNAWRGEIAKG